MEESLADETTLRSSGVGSLFQDGGLFDVRSFRRAFYEVQRSATPPGTSLNFRRHEARGHRRLHRPHDLPGA